MVTMHVRVKNDLYTTNEGLTKALLPYLALQPDDTVLEPCDGQGHISRYLHKQGHKVITTDLAHADYDQFVLPRDATQIDFWEQWGNTDWVVTNPPYNAASQIVPLAFTYARRGVAMLLRISWIMEPCKDRAPFLSANSKHLRYVLSFNPRPQFRIDTKGTDSATVAWAVWDKQWEGNTELIYVTNWR